MNEETCIYKKCNHSDEEHRDGNCYRVTQPDKKDFDKFCPCSYSAENHRLFDTVGYMLLGPNDVMITKLCVACGDPIMALINEVMCIKCKHSNI